jgi:prepilin-type N-terminal cleavage/methylation domain-containing protein
MISRIADRLRSARGNEDGFTIIEVMVAMTIFAVIAAGIAAGITASLVLSKDTRAREVASTVAMEDIDSLRDLPSIFDIKSGTATPTVGNQTFALTREVSWTRSSGSATACGTGDGSLSYKAVTVTVSWKTSASSSGSQQVTMSSAIAPLTNINSDTTGSILIGVTNANGLGVSGIVPTITGPAGVTVPATDAEGCTYVSGVAPGTYTVKIARTGYVDSNQQASPSSQTVTVAAGASGAAAFSFDAAAKYTFGYTTTPSVGAILPTNMPTTLINPASGTTQLTNTAGSASLFPFGVGYRAVAGTYVVDASGAASSTTCLAPEPGSWTTPNAKGKVGTPSEPANNTSTVAVQMGAVKLSKLTAGQYLTAKTTTPVSGDPGCAVGMTLQFPVLKADTATIALPWGTWRVYSGSSAGSTTNALTLKTENAAMVTNGAVTGGVVMVDPRPAS